MRAVNLTSQVLGNGLAQDEVRGLRSIQGWNVTNTWDSVSIQMRNIKILLQFMNIFRKTIFPQYKSDQTIVTRSG